MNVTIDSLESIVRSMRREKANALSLSTFIEWLEEMEGQK